ncbi:unnamed protein product [Bursaphelenchus okinawaensis]|uniref:Uncharacterized protein n=1 Tax=Bursaphelenchus okinawaensis TaxID=465554 RepID=A0A811K976_9BILA|nr:unnamed protein product [Bursaphelenchus okinawaensis]CAG9094737.1 unnamed protein product [Bursaphelenchus okinawaensis]
MSTVSSEVFVDQLQKAWQKADSLRKSTELEEDLKVRLNISTSVTPSPTFLAKVDNTSETQPEVNTAIVPILNRSFLPKLQVQRFNGDVTQWLSWRPSFYSAIHDRNDVDNNTKLLYLKACLTGDDEDELSGVCSLGYSYSTVIHRLQDRFGNQSRLRTQLHTQLASIKPAEKSTPDLRSTYRLSLP